MPPYLQQRTRSPSPPSLLETVESFGPIALGGAALALLALIATIFIYAFGLFSSAPLEAVIRGDDVSSLRPGAAVVHGVEMVGKVKSVERQADGSWLAHLSLTKSGRAVLPPDVSFVVVNRLPGLTEPAVATESPGGHATASPVDATARAAVDAVYRRTGWWPVVGAGGVTFVLLAAFALAVRMLKGILTIALLLVGLAACGIAGAVAFVIIGHLVR